MSAFSAAAATRSGSSGELKLPTRALFAPLLPRAMNATLVFLPGGVRNTV